MIPYFAIILTPIFFIFSKNQKNQILYLWFFLILLTLFLGLRFEMGTDWYEYSKDFYLQNKVFEETLIEDFLRIKYFLNLSIVNLIGHMPFYKLNLVLSNFITKNVIFFNVVNSFIAVYGTYLFCKILNLRNSNTWLMISFLLPFLFFISTDVIRQYSGLVCVNIAFAYLLKSQKKLFIYFCIAAILFHLSSIIFLFSLIFVDKKVRNYFLIFISFTSIVSFLYSGEVIYFKLFKFYLSEERLMTYSININIFLVLFIIFISIYLYKKQIFNRIEHKIILFFMFYGLFCFIISLIDDTASYRLSIYLIIFFCIILQKFMNTLSGEQLIWFKSSTYTFSLLLVFVWLNFSNHSHVYVPYKNVLFLGKNFINTKTQVCAQKPFICNFVQ